MVVEGHHLRRFNVSVIEIGWFMNETVSGALQGNKVYVLLDVDEKAEGDEGVYLMSKEESASTFSHARSFERTSPTLKDFVTAWPMLHIVPEKNHATHVPTGRVDHVLIDPSTLAEHTLSCFGW